MYRIAPVDTWAIFVERDQDFLAQKMLENFGQQIIKIEGFMNSITKAPKIFRVNEV